MMFHQRRTAFHPIPVVAVQGAIDIANFRVVDMPTNNAVDLALFGNVGKGRLKVSDKLDRVFDLKF